MISSPYIRLSLTVLLMASMNANAQIPQATTGRFALTHATIETVTQGAIEDGTVLLDSGKIIAVGKNVAVPSGFEQMDCHGLFIYPGLIDGGTILGLSEIDMDPRTRDFDEIGDVIPQVKALTAVNPNAAAIPVTRVNGVTTVLSSPRGGLFPGSAALINLFGYTSDQMYAGFEGVVLEFPRSGRKSIYDNRSGAEMKKDLEKDMNRLESTWKKVVEYARLDSATKGHASYYPEMHALEPVVTGKSTLLVEVNDAGDILSALKWIKGKHIRKAVLTGVAEGWRVADQIAESGIPVIAGPVLFFPPRVYDRYDKCYANPGLLWKAGVKVALRTSESENVRNLPYNAGFAATYGMGKEEALKAVTIIPAQIFGVDDKLGSIEKGKQATLFVTDGDPFETKTQVKYLFISGWKIPLVSRQTLLYDEFLHREPGLNGIKGE